VADSIAVLSPGDEARVLGYEDPTTPYARHLLSLGLVPGTSLKLVRRAPLGDPVEIHFRGSRVVLRPSEAMGLRLERI
jgi:Fe2+ transport system protein FeoA